VQLTVCIGSPLLQALQQNRWRAENAFLLWQNVQLVVLQDIAAGQDIVKIFKTTLSGRLLQLTLLEPKCHMIDMYAIV
jgi:hypothetical protein